MTILKMEIIFSTESLLSTYDVVFKNYSVLQILRPSILNILKLIFFIMTTYFGIMLLFHHYDISAYESTIRQIPSQIHRPFLSKQLDFQFVGSVLVYLESLILKVYK